MLQWYGNMPEDTNYWVKRFNVPTLKFTIFLALALNFLFPLLVILKRGNKRNYKIIGFASVVIIFGHYLDFFNMVSLEPNAVEEAHHAAKHEASIQKADYTLLAENKGAKEAVAAAEAVATTEAVAATDAVKEEVHATEVNVEHAAEAHGEHAEGHGEHAEEVKSYVGLGIFELMVLAGFVGAFLFMFFNTLSKEPLINESDPYLKESLRHHVEYA
jgi:hypothetical protein